MSPPEEVVPPLANYSPVVTHNGIAYCAGALGIDPKTGEMAAGGVSAQTAQALHNIDATLRSVSSSLSELLFVHCYLSPDADFDEFDAAFGRVLGSRLPARATVRVNLVRADAQVELVAVATTPPA